MNIPVVNLVVLVLLLGGGRGLRVCGTGEEVQVRSTGRDGQLQIVISIPLASLGTQITMTLINGQGNPQPYLLRVEQDQLGISPAPQPHRIIFNYRQGNEYLLGITSLIKDRQAHFVPITLSCQQHSQTLLLPLLDVTMGNIVLSSLLSCHRTLVSVGKTESALLLQLFTLSKGDSIWQFRDPARWHHTWRHHFRHVYFGGASSQNLLEPVQIHLTSGEFCVFNPNELPPNSQPIKIKPSYTIGDLLLHVPALDLFQAQEKIQEL